MRERKGQTTGVENELWGAVYKRLLPWTMRRHRVDQVDAEEMVQDAVRLFIKSGGVADPHDLGGLFAALGSNINGVAIDRRRKKARRAVSLTEDGDSPEPADPEHPAERIERAEEARKVIGVLLDRVQNDNLMTGIVLQMADGVLEPAAQAEALGRDVSEVYNARRRLRIHADAVRKTKESW